MGVKEEDSTLTKIMPPIEQEINDEINMKVKKYLRGEGANLEGLRDKKLKGQLAIREELYGKSAKAAAKAEKVHVHLILIMASAVFFPSLFFPVSFDLGPYTLDFTSGGRYMALGGHKGHLAIIDMKNMGLIKEFQVRETVRDMAFLHNELFFAAAQKKYLYICNRQGTELHCLKEHGAVLKLQFLKNHFLLASINKFGQLHYQDVTTGEMVGNYRTRLGCCDVMQVNPFNSVVALGHSNGTVTMWKPTSPTPLVKMLANHGPVSALAFHSNGHLMATAGYQVNKVLFRPYKDVLGIGHSMGWSSILIPGSGEPNFDSWVANPFETSKQRREKEVRSLLDKLPPETILLDPTKIGTVKPTRKREKPIKQEREVEMEAAIGAAKSITQKNKTKGRNKPSKKAKKRQEGIERAKKPFLEQQMEEEESSKKKKQKIGEESELPKSLQRFACKKATS
ncbi:hypothetical protein ACSBR2_036761 [Camellia fascicularis]